MDNLIMFVDSRGELKAIFDGWLELYIDGAVVAEEACHKPLHELKEHDLVYIEITNQHGE